jgi:hypothetical protein
VENPVLIDNDKSDNTDTEAASTDSNPDDPGQRDYSGDGSIAADEDDEFLPVDEVIRRALHLEDSTEKPTYFALAAQGANETSFLDGYSASMPGYIDGSKGMCIDSALLQTRQLLINAQSSQLYLTMMTIRTARAAEASPTI